MKFNNICFLKNKIPFFISMSDTEIPIKKKVYTYKDLIKFENSSVFSALGS